MKRFQSRRANGRFTRNTLGNTFGLGCEVCPKCGKCHPWSLLGGEEKPTTCKRCGASLTAEVLG